jgi:hypothetical protein
MQTAEAAGRGKQERTNGENENSDKSHGSYGERATLPSGPVCPRDPPICECLCSEGFSRITLFLPSLSVVPSPAERCFYSSQFSCTNKPAAASLGHKLRLTLTATARFVRGFIVISTA